MVYLMLRDNMFLKGKFAVLVAVALLMSFPLVTLADPQICIDVVDPSSGPPGTSVFVSGYGATALGEVRVYFGDTIYYLHADINGYWQTFITVPNVTPGDYNIRVTDVTTETTDTAIFKVTYPQNPKIHVSPKEGAIGVKITVSGERFNPGSSIYVAFEDLVFFTPIYIDNDGEFNVTVFVPAVNSGNYTIKAVSAYYMEMRTLANVTFTVTMGLDTLFESSSGIQNALNQTQTDVQAVIEETSKASGVATEARIYALIAMVFAMVAAILSAATLIKKG